MNSPDPSPFCMTEPWWKGIIVALDRNGAITHLNEKGCTILACSVEKVLGKLWIDTFIKESERDQVRSVFNNLMAGNLSPYSTVEGTVITSMGIVRFIRWYNSLNKDAEGVITGTISYGEDITEEKQVQESLRKMQQFQESVIANANIWIAVLSRDSTILVWNDAAEAISGYKKSEVIGKKTVWKQLYPDMDYRRKVTGEIRRVIGRDQYLENFETEIYCADGTKKVIVWNTRGLRDNEGAISGYIVIGRDITERKLAEEALQKNEEKFRGLFEYSRDGIVIADAKTMQFVDNNQMFSQMIGYNPEEIKNLSVPDIHPEDARSHVLEAFEKIARHEVDVARDLPVKRKNGTIFYADISSYPMNIFNKDCQVGVFRDITERKRAEEAMRESKILIDAVVENVPLMIFLKEAKDLRFVIFNRAGEELLGYDRQVLLGKNNLDLFPPEQATNFMTKDREVLDGDAGMLDIPEEPIMTAKKGLRLLHTRKVCIRGADGTTKFLLGISEDITERKRAEEEQENVRRWQDGVNQILESILSPIALDQKLKIITDGVVEIFGADFCRIWLIDKGDRCSTGCIHAEVTEGPHVCRYRDKCLHLKASSGRYTHIDGRGHCRVPFGAYKIGLIASGEEEKFLTNDVEHDPRVHDHEWAKSLGLVAFSGYRLKPSDGEVLGVFALFTRFPISPDMDAILEGLSRAISLAIQKDIADKTLIESRQLFSDIISFLPDPTFVIDTEGKVLAWNRALEHHSGISAGDMIGKGDHEYSLWQYGIRRPLLIDLVLHPDQDAGRLNYSDIRMDGHTVTAQTEIIQTGNGHTTSLLLIASPLVDAQGNITGAIESIRDISRLKDTEAELARINQNLEEIVRDRTRALEDEIARRIHAEKDVKDSLNYTRSVIEANPDVTMVLDGEATVMDVNAATESLTGVPREKMIGTSGFSYLVDDGTLHDIFSRLLEKGRIETNVQARRTDGHITPLSINATFIRGTGVTDTRIIVAGHDITRQKHDEESIKASLDEKILLLREVHHRVKNNLQIIISLISLQMRQTGDPLVKQIMSETQNRVRAMSLVHEKLYRSESLSHIDFADYTRFLATQLFSFYGMDTRRVRLEFAMEKILMDINTAVPLGLLMNELISNSLRHAFPGGREGVISISGGNKDDLMTLVVRDNGIGISEELDWKSTTSLGMQLVISLVDQVDGTITLDRENGTMFTITVKRAPHQQETDDGHIQAGSGQSESRAGKSP